MLGNVQRIEATNQIGIDREFLRNLPETSLVGFLRAVLRVHQIAHHPDRGGSNERFKEIQSFATLFDRDGPGIQTLIEEINRVAAFETRAIQIRNDLLQLRAKREALALNRLGWMNNLVTTHDLSLPISINNSTFVVVRDVKLPTKYFGIFKDFSTTKESQAALMDSIEVGKDGKGYFDNWSFNVAVKQELRCEADGTVYQTLLGKTRKIPLTLVGFADLPRTPAQNVLIDGTNALGDIPSELEGALCDKDLGLSTSILLNTAPQPTKYSSLVGLTGHGQAPQVLSAGFLIEIRQVRKEPLKLPNRFDESNSVLTGEPDKVSRQKMLFNILSNYSVSYHEEFEQLVTWLDIKTEEWNQLLADTELGISAIRVLEDAVYHQLLGPKYFTNASTFCLRHFGINYAERFPRVSRRALCAHFLAKNAFDKQEFLSHCEQVLRHAPEFIADEKTGAALRSRFDAESSDPKAESRLKLIIEAVGGLDTFGQSNAKALFEHMLEKAKKSKAALGNFGSYLTVFLNSAHCSTSLRYLVEFHLSPKKKTSQDFSIEQIKELFAGSPELLFAIALQFVGDNSYFSDACLDDQYSPRCYLEALAGNLELLIPGQIERFIAAPKVRESVARLFNWCLENADDVSALREHASRLMANDLLSVCLSRK